MIVGRCSRVPEPLAPANAKKVSRCRIAWMGWAALWVSIACEAEPQPNRDARPVPATVVDMTHSERESGHDAGSSETDAGVGELDARAEPICEAGRQASCPCAGGTIGVQLCAADGSRWQACQCPDAEGRCAPEDSYCDGLYLYACDGGPELVGASCEEACSTAGFGSPTGCGVEADGVARCQCAEPGCTRDDNWCEGNTLNFCATNGEMGRDTCSNSDCRRQGYEDYLRCDVENGYAHCICSPAPWNDCRECVVERCGAEMLDCGSSCREYLWCMEDCNGDGHCYAACNGDGTSYGYREAAPLVDCAREHHCGCLY